MRAVFVILFFSFRAVVGAPFCDNKGRGGSVFLYLSSKDDSGLQPERYLEIRGATAEGQFGLAISRLGDLNRDGYEDFAVGAPYEDRGAVYIFLGSFHGVGDPAATPAAGWLKAEEGASQIIRAADLLAAGHLPLPANMATFGSSLSGGQDMDGNSYPGGWAKYILARHSSKEIFGAALFKIL